MTSPTLDCLNQDRAPRLEDLILAEVFLAGGPCYIHRLWAEMFERQKSISVGMLLFTREVMRLEQDGLLREIDGNRTAITKQGEVHLFGLVLLGMIPAAQKRRLQAKGVLGVAKQLTNEVSHEGRSAEVVGVKPGAGCGEKSPVESNSDTQLLSENSMTSNEGGVEGKPIEALPFKSLGVAEQASGNAPLTDGLQVGSNGGGASHFLPSPPYLLASEIVDKVEMAEQERLEDIEAEREGLMTEMSGYPQPGRWA